MRRCSQILTRSVLRARPCSSSSRILPISHARSLWTRHPVRSQFQPLSVQGLRFKTSLTAPESGEGQIPERAPVPSYQLTFTCKPCSHRSAHRITKQGYHHGTVLIQCPNCKSRHVISDHLKIFMDEASTLEDILKRTAGTDQDVSKLLRKGRLGQREGQLIGNEGEEDLEFWEDGTTSKHSPS